MDDLGLSGGQTIPASDLTERFSRSGGPGGQHANKTSSKVELLLDLRQCQGLSPAMRHRALQKHGQDVITVIVEKSRSQFRNRQIARSRMIEKLEELLRPPPAKRRKTRPSRAAKQRRLDAKKRTGEKKRKRGRVDWD